MSCLPCGLQGSDGRTAALRYSKFCWCSSNQKTLEPSNSVRTLNVIGPKDLPSKRVPRSGSCPDVSTMVGCWNVLWWSNASRFTRKVLCFLSIAKQLLMYWCYLNRSWKWSNQWIFSDRPASVFHFCNASSTSKKMPVPFTLNRIFWGDPFTFHRHFVENSQPVMGDRSLHDICHVFPCNPWGWHICLHLPQNGPLLVMLQMEF